MKDIEVKCTCSTHGRSGEMRTKVWFRKRNRREVLADQGADWTEPAGSIQPKVADRNECRVSCE